MPSRIQLQLIAVDTSSRSVDQGLGSGLRYPVPDNFNAPPARKRRKTKQAASHRASDSIFKSLGQDSSSGTDVPNIVMSSDVTTAMPPVPPFCTAQTIPPEQESLAEDIARKAEELCQSPAENIASDSLPARNLSLSRYLLGRTDGPSSAIGIIASAIDGNPKVSIMQDPPGKDTKSPLPLPEAPRSKTNINQPQVSPRNPDHIKTGVESVIQSSSTLSYLPIVVDNEVLNKRPLVSALERLHIQLHGHDSLEADFLLDARTACLQLPLLSLPSTMDQLVSRSIMLAQRFEHLVIIFALYPIERMKTAVLPNPWNIATRDAFSRFEGRLKRQIAVKMGSTYEGQFSHTINIYLSDDSMTMAALLRMHLEKAQMPIPPTDLSRWTMEPLEENAFAWLSTELDSVS